MGQCSIPVQRHSCNSASFFSRPWAGDGPSSLLFNPGPFHSREGSPSMEFRLWCIGYCTHPCDLAGRGGWAVKEERNRGVKLLVSPPVAQEFGS